MRRIIISDAHGCAGRVQALLQKIGFDRRENQLIVLGDMLDGSEEATNTAGTVVNNPSESAAEENGGVSPAEMYILLRSLKEEMEERFVYIRGEHEQMFMDAELLTRGQIANGLLWKQNGGNLTLSALKSRGIGAGKTAAWLRDHTRLWYEEQEFICVHGDIQSDVVWNNSQETFLWGNEGVRCNNYSGKLAVVGHSEVEFPTVLDGSGAESRFHPQYGTWFELPRRGMIAMDTGCGSREDGVLTALLIENGWMRFEAC